MTLARLCPKLCTTDTIARVDVQKKKTTYGIIPIRVDKLGCLDMVNGEEGGKRDKKNYLI